MQLPQYKPGVPCKAVATHFRCHEDELGAFVGLKHYGDRMHPGISQAIKNKQFLLFDAGLTGPGGKTWQQLHEEEGIVCVGVAGSPYDEHGLPDHLRGQECAATLVAKSLGIAYRPEMKLFLDLLLQHDRNGENFQLSNSANIRRMHKYWSKKGLGAEIETIEYGMQALEMFLVAQQQFFNETKKEYDEYARNTKIRYRGNLLNITTICSDNEDISAYAKYRGAQLVIVKNQRGHTFIDTAKSPVIVLNEVIANLRMRELDLKRGRYHYQDPKLYEEGAYPGLDEWYFQQEAGRIMNGSPSAPNKPPTRIQFREVVDIVINTLKNAAMVKPIASPLSIAK